jgi:hypothetical protein
MVLQQPKANTLLDAAEAAIHHGVQEWVDGEALGNLANVGA